MKSTSTVTPPQKENREESLFIICATTIDQWKEDVSSHFVPSYFKHIVKFSYRVKITFESYAKTMAYCRLYSSVERNGAHRGTKVSFGNAMMQAFELLWLAKCHT